jgi:tetratricopeptide (TPR) repeat protein
MLLPLSNRLSIALMTVGLASAGPVEGVEVFEGQEPSSRYRVLAPPLAPVGGADDDFGKEVAERFRDALEAFPRHAPYGGRELRDALRQYHVKEDELARQDCARGLQLAGLVRIPLVMCGSYERVAGGMRVMASIVSPDTGDRFDVPPFTAMDARQAAQRIVREFEAYVQALSSTVFCQDDIRNEAWASALEKCNAALEALPNGKTASYLKATALWNLDSLATALELFQRVIALDAMHVEALKAAGIVATRLEQRELGRQYFAEVLRLTPNDLAVRLAIVGDLAQAGDPEGGLALLEDVLSGDSVESALKKYAGELALAAALKRSGDACAADCTMPAEARALFEQAYGFFFDVMETAETAADSSMIGNMGVVLNKLGRTAELLALAERVQREHLDANANFWIAYAEALKEAGDVAGAIDALGRAARLDPNARVYGRLTAWLIDSGQLDAAVDSGRIAVGRAELDSSTLAKMMAISAYNAFAKSDQHTQAIAYYETAREFAADPESAAMLDFFHGFSLLRQAIEAEAPQTLASARIALPMFQRAREMIAIGQGYEWAASSVAQLLDNADRFIEIQDAIIRRGR